MVLHRLEQEESRVEEDYAKLMGRLHDPVDRQIAEEAMDEERDHATTLRMLAGPAPTPRFVLDSILQRERWHVRGTGWIGDAIYGVNDGLGAVFGIVSGMAGYTGGQRSGAGRRAGGHAGQRAVDGRGRVPGVEVGARGVRVGGGARESRDPGGSAGRAARARAVLSAERAVAGRSVEHGGRLQNEPKQFLRALVHEELGLSEETFPNPMKSTISATVSTAIGGFIPIIPFFFTIGMPAVIASFVISTIAHFAVGASKALITTRPWWATGLEMTAVGVIEAAVTYGVGVALRARLPDV